jgi:hypothetical protein
MTALFVPWLLLALFFLLLRRASWLDGAAGDDRHDIEGVAASVPISLAAIDCACEQARLAQDAGHGDAAARLLRGARDAIAFFGLGLGREIAKWGATTWGLHAAPNVVPLHRAGVRTPGLRLAGRGELWCRLMLPGNIGRLRLHLFVLRCSLGWLLLQLHSLRLRSGQSVWYEWDGLLSDLHVLTGAALRARAALTDSSGAYTTCPQFAAPSR